MYRTPPKRPTSFSPFQKTVIHCKARRQEDAGRPVARSLWCPPKHTDTTNCFGDSYQEAHSEPLDALPADPPNWSTGTPNALCTWTPSPCGHFPIHISNGGKSEPLQIASEHMQKKLGKLYDTEMEDTNSSISVLPERKGENRRLSVPGMTLQNWEKAYNLKTFFSRSV